MWIWAFLKKDLLLFWKDWKELLTLIAAPFVMILILGLALGGALDGSAGESFDIQTAIVVHDNEIEGLESFRQSLDSLSLSDDEKAELSASAEDLLPYSMLRELLENEELRQLIHLQELTESEAVTALENEEIDVMITVQEDFTLKALNHILLNEREKSSELIMVSDEDSQQYAGIVEHIINQFFESFHFQTSVSVALGEDVRELEAVDGITPQGGLEITDVRPISAFQYFSITMPILFALIVASSTATRALVEKRQRTFSRILLAGRHPIGYLSGKISTGFILTMQQLLLLFILSHFVFSLYPDRSAQFWLGILIIAAVISFFVGCMSALLTALNFKFGSDIPAIIFTIAATTMLPLAGGSLGPGIPLPDWLLAIGSWMPNGISLNMFMQVMLEEPMQVLVWPGTKLVVMSIILLIMAMIIFPKRGRVG